VRLRDKLQLCHLALGRDNEVGPHVAADTAGIVVISMGSINTDSRTVDTVTADMDLDINIIVIVANRLLLDHIAQDHHTLLVADSFLIIDIVPDFAVVDIARLGFSYRRVSEYYYCFD